MNFWHMQLHPNEADGWTREDVLNLVRQNIIGIGKESNRYCLLKFKDVMAIGDVVLIRHQGPLCLVQVTGNSFENTDKNKPDAYFYYCRKIKILAIDADYSIQNSYRNEYGKTWNEGLVRLTTIIDRANYCQFIRYWYDMALLEKSNNHCVETSVYTVNEILQQDLAIHPSELLYKWEKTQVEQLLNDIYNHKNINTKSRYRIGSLILCIDRYLKNDPLLTDFSIDIVDGHQRITTLLLVLAILNPCYSHDFFCELEYNHSPSYENISKNRDIIHAWIKEKNLTKEQCLQFFEYIGDKCELVQVIAYSKCSIPRMEQEKN